MKKKVVLLGDSIRQAGYGLKVPQMLGEEYEVYQSPYNDRFAKYLHRVLFDDRALIEGADVIHWNNGQWDVTKIFGDGPFTPLQEYVETMLRIAKILKKYAKKVIFATTTPVRLDNEYNDNETIMLYNATLVPLLEKEGIIINDLFSICNQDINKYIREDDKIHLTDYAIDVLAKQVTDYIKKALEE